MREDGMQEVQQQQTSMLPRVYQVGKQSTGWEGGGNAGWWVLGNGGGLWGYMQGRGRGDGA